MSSIVVFRGRLPGVTAEHGELVWKNSDSDGMQVFATVIARRSCREVYVELTTDESSLDGAATGVGVRDVSGEGMTEQLFNNALGVTSLYTNVMGLLTEAFERKKTDDAFLFGSLEQWSSALSQVLPKILPWDGPVRLSIADMNPLIKELDAHLRSAYPGSSTIPPA